MGYRSAAVMACVVGACTGSSDYRCPGANQTVIEICPDYSKVLFVAYRDGDQAWQTPMVVDGTNKMCVTDDYVVLTVFDLGGGFLTSENATTVAETNPTITTCGVDTSPVPTDVMVSGEMAAGGEIWINNANQTASAQAAPWPFVLDVLTGQHDLIATSFGTPGNILIRRDQDIDSDTVEPEVDVVADGIPMTPVTLSVTGEEGGIGSTVSFRTRTTNVLDLAFGDLTIDVVPASLIEPGDEQDLRLFAGTSAFSQGATTRFTGSETSFAMLPPFTTASFSGQTASWASLPIATFTSVEVDLSIQLQLGEMNVSATKGWLVARGATSLGIDTSAPGYDPSWQLDPTASSFTRTVSVYNDSTSIEYYTSYVETSN